MKEENKEGSTNRIAGGRVLNIYRKTPEVAASISKLVEDRDNVGRSKTTTTVEELGLGQANKKMITEKGDVSNIFKLFPEFKFVADIVTTMTLSSIDQSSYNVRYKLEDNPFPTDVNGRILKVIADHLEKEYNITEDLYGVAYECLFGSGAYVETIIPENVLDDIISSRIGSPTGVAMENDDYKDAVKNLLSPNSSNGFLGNATSQTSMEDNNASVYDPTHTHFDTVEITDNWNLLKSPSLKKADIKSKVREAMGIMSGSIDLEDDLIYRKPQNTMKAEMLKLENLNLRKPIGKPSITKINSEAVIPVFMKSNPEEYLACFILIDDEGMPVTKEQGDDTFTEDIAMASGSVDFQQSDATKKLSTAAKNLGLIAEDEPLNDNIVKKYGEFIEEDLKKRLSNGLHGGLAGFNGSQELYKIMLHKTLRNIGCKLLYVPAEMIQYTALDYRKNGTGTSLMHDLVLVASMRAALLMSGVNNELQANIPTTIVDVTLDPNDQTPEKTFDMIKAYVHKMKENNMQDFTLDPVSINDWLSSQGVRFQIGEHPKLPNVKIEFSQEELNSKPTVDDKESSLDRLTKSMVMSVGLMPEIIDSMQDSTFASISEANRVLMDRRTYIRRRVLMKHITAKVKKILRSDESLHRKVYAVFEDNKKSLRKNIFNPSNLKYNITTKPAVNEWLLSLYIDKIVATLPSQSGDDEDLTEEFGKYKDSLEERIELQLGEGVGSLLGDLEEYREPALELWKNHLLRTWCVDNNYMPEVDLLTQTDSVGTPLVNLKDIASEMVDGLSASTEDFVKLMLEYEAKATKKVEEAEAAAEEEQRLIEEAENEPEPAVITDDGDGGDEPPLEDEPPEEPTDDGDGEDEPPPPPPEEE